MILVLDKLTKVVEKYRTKKSDVVFQVPVPDHIPYACHFDTDTILTKNGELIQIIKITGFSGEVVGASKQELRDVIRKSIKHHITSSEFSLWFHTMRCKRSLTPEGNFNNEFAFQLNEAWGKKHHWDHKYVNEVYISIIHGGMSSSLRDIRGLIQALIYKRLEKTQLRAFNAAHKRLKQVVDNVLQTLEEFGARRLTLVEKKGVFYSEQLEFFSKIVNLIDKPMPVPAQDLSICLASHKIAFGFNILEVQNPHSKRFAALFTIKDYQEMPTWALDEFLQLSCEFIITQTVDFLNSRMALKYFKQQDHIYQVSGAKDMSRVSGIDTIMQCNRGEATDYGRSQLTILVIGDTLDELTTHINDLTFKVTSLGILLNRRDLRLEECFWAQLPGNFSYISRSKPINAARLGGLASLYNFPAGKSEGNQWGPAVTIFYTLANTPYFFNFHIDKCGHTTILGPYGSGKTVLMNFLVAQAQKYHGKLFFFDQNLASKVFVKVLGGYYTQIIPTVRSPEYAFNPFYVLSIDDNKVNRQYLSYWLSLLIYSQGKEVKQTYYAHFDMMVEYLANLPADQRMLRNVVGYLREKGLDEFAELFSPWHSEGSYACLFDNHPNDIVPLRGMIYGFDMSYVVENTVCHGPLVSYLLHRVEMGLDGTPTLIVLDEAWKLIDNPIFAPSLAEWLDRMQVKNAVVIFASESVKNASKSEMTVGIIEKISTQIFLPNPNAFDSSKDYNNLWGLSEHEFEMLTSMDSQKRQFMLRQLDESVIAQLDLGGMKELAVLSGGEKALQILDLAISQRGNKVEDWLPAFYQIKEDRKS